MAPVSAVRAAGDNRPRLSPQVDRAALALTWHWQRRAGGGRTLASQHHLARQSCRLLLLLLPLLPLLLLLLLLLAPAGGTDEDLVARLPQEDPKALVTYMIDTAARAPVQRAAAQRIRELARDDSKCDPLVAAGAARALLLALERHPNDAQLANTAFTALRNLAAGTDAGRDARRDALMRAGAGESLVQALQRHMDKEVANAACRALWNLAAGTDAGLGARRDALMRAGAGESLVQALQRHMDKEVAEAACRALWNLAWGSPSRKSALAAAGARVAVTRALPLLPDWKYGGWDQWP
jgi:hypothetical protein